MVPVAAMAWDILCAAVQPKKKKKRKGNKKERESKPRLKKPKGGSSHYGSAVTNPIGIPEDAVSTPGLTQWIQSCHSLGCRCGSDPVLLWLWQRLVAEALIQPLVQELPYVMDAALKEPKRKEKKKIYAQKSK